MENQNTKKGRIFFIDNIRWLMLVFVVLMHINVTYSSIGSWYYRETKELDNISLIIFGIYGSFTQAYFMGFLFLIAGYFVPGSFDRKGGGKFITDRLIRLGIPTLIFMLILHPITIIILDRFLDTLQIDYFTYYKGYISSFDFISGSGPMWFAFALLIFTVIYAVPRILFIKSSANTKDPDRNIISYRNIFLLALLMSVITFLVRIIFPIGTSVLNMQLCFFTQYIILFCAGIIAYRYDLISKITYKMGMNWFKIALFAGIPLWFLIVIFGGVISGSTEFTGGSNWQSAAYSFWESFFCIGICLGLIVLFREKYNSQGKMKKFLSDNAFGVYVFHAPILVLISLLMKNWHAYPLLKWLAVAIITIPVCFGTVYLIRKIPGMKKLFS